MPDDWDHQAGRRLRGDPDMNARVLVNDPGLVVDETTADYERDARAARERARGLIERYVSGAMEPGRVEAVAWGCEPGSIETPERHGHCPLCA